MRLRQQMQSMRFAIMNWVTKTSLFLFPRYAVEEGRIYFLAARTDQRIANPEVREEREVAVRTPQLSNAMLSTERSDSCVMNLGTHDLALVDQALQGVPVPRTFSKGRQGR